MKLIYIALLSVSIIYGGEVKSSPSFQGFLGVVNTPNAQIVADGDFGLLFANQVDNLSSSSSSNFRDNKVQESYFLNMGVLPYLDMSFRYTYLADTKIDKQYLSDRSLSFKYQIPFISNDTFKVALGIQDISGTGFFNTKYIVSSYEIDKFRASFGYAYTDEVVVLDGFFGSLEYQPFNWLQLGVEYDSKEYNGVVKANHSFNIYNQQVDLGIMAKSSIDHKDIYMGVYANFPFNDKSLPLHLTKKDIDRADLDSLPISNISSKIVDDTLLFEYENSIYNGSEIDTLGLVLGSLVSNEKSKNIVVTVKKANIAQYRVKINSKDYREFLSSGVYKPDLMVFDYDFDKANIEINKSDIFRPLVTLSPNFIFVDGSEYGHLDYTLAMGIDLSMRIANGTIISTRYNLPISMSDIFKDGGIFDYRNRNKTTPDIDQALLSQFFQTNISDISAPWINLVQVGLFDNELSGISWESAISSLSGRHQFMLKLSYLKDNIYESIDRYSNSDIRSQKLVSYKYYFDEYNSNIKLTAGEFLYGDKGAKLTLQRYFSDIDVEFDIAQTTHPLRGDNTLAKLSISIPFGTKRRYHFDYVDLQFGDIKYERRKTIKLTEDTLNYAQPHHLKEINNNYTLENYFLDSGRSHPSYIEQNHNRLRNIFLEF